MYQLQDVEGMVQVAEEVAETHRVMAAVQDEVRQMTPEERGRHLLDAAGQIALKALTLSGSQASAIVALSMALGTAAAAAGISLVQLHEGVEDFYLRGLERRAQLVRNEPV